MGGNSDDFPLISDINLELWSVCQGESDGKRAIVRYCTGVAPLVGHPDYPQVLRVIVSLTAPDEEGLPDKAELEQLTQLEDALDAAVRENDDALPLYIATANGLREFLYQVRDLELAVARAGAVAKECATHTIQIAGRDDPGWETYVEMQPDVNSDEDGDEGHELDYPDDDETEGRSIFGRLLDAVMFWKKKPVCASPDELDFNDWALLDGEMMDAPVIGRVCSGAEPMVGHPKYPHCVQVMVELRKPTRDGLATRGEDEDLRPLADLLIKNLTPNHEAVPAAVVTNKGIRAHTFYSSNPASTIYRANAIGAAFGQYEVEAVSNKDPKWFMYRALLIQTTEA